MNQDLTLLKSEAVIRSGNRILSQAPPAFWDRLSARLSPVTLHRGQVLHETGDAVENIYFLSDGFVSLMQPGSEAMQVECGVVGREGAVGAEAILGVVPGHRSFAVPSIARAVVMATASAYVLPVKVLRDECRRDEALRERVGQSARLQWSQASQMSLCNRLHSVEQRLARWLLTTRDRLQPLPDAHRNGTSNGSAPEGVHHNGSAAHGAEPEIAITQEAISSLLGAHRPGVTVALGLLQTSGLIRSRRGHITVTNVAGLHDLSCPCYDVIRHNFQSLDG